MEQLRAGKIDQLWMAVERKNGLEGNAINGSKLVERATLGRIARVMGVQKQRASLLG
jgi:hypothetical protein